MEQSNFQKVKEFHKVFQHPINQKPDNTVFDTNKSLVKLRLNLIQEEVKELSEAIEQKNMKEVADALADILYVVYGAGHAFGINLDEAFKLVHESNMTKACKNIKEAEDTLEYIKTEARYPDPCIKSSEDGKYYIVYDNQTGKILKNKYYSPVDLSSVL